MSLNKHHFNQPILVIPRKKSLNAYFFIWFILSFFSIISESHAYMDPNTGGILFQLFFPILIAIFGSVSIFQKNVVNFWKRLIRKQHPKKEDLDDT